MTHAIFRQRLAAAGVAAAALAGCGEPGRTHVVTSTSPPPRTPSYPSPSSRTSTAGATNVGLPATFTIEAGERLRPTFVGAPAGVTIDLTVVSADGRAHAVTAARHALWVPAGGRASVALSGLRRGTYALVIDGARRGSLIVGVQPGP